MITNYFFFSTSRLISCASGCESDKRETRQRNVANKREVPVRVEYTYMYQHQHPGLGSSATSAPSSLRCACVRCVLLWCISYRETGL